MITRDMTDKPCGWCGYPLTIGGCEHCNHMRVEPVEDSAEDVAISKALSDPRFDAEFDRIFGRGGWK